MHLGGCFTALDIQKSLAVRPFIRAYEVGMSALMLNTVAKRIQHCCSHLRIKKLDDVENDV